MSPVLGPPKRSSTKPITSKEVKHFDQVPAGKFFEVTYQLGPDRSFGRSTGTGKWTETREVVGGPAVRSPVYSVWSRIVDGNSANGIIEENNSWRAKNLRGFNPTDLNGQLGKMLAVVEVKELKDYVPDTVSTLSGTFSYELFQAMIAREVKLATQSQQTHASSKG